MRRKARGSFTIEAAVIVPIILMILGLILTLLFYCHDKNVVTAITHETLVSQCGNEELSAEAAEQYLQKRIQDKLLLFGRVHCEALIQDEELTISCSARKKQMSIKVQMSMKKTNPEQYIWQLRRLWQIKK